MTSGNKRTCREYRQEMRLLGLKRRLEAPDLSRLEREELLKEIRRLRVEMGMD